MNSAKYLLFYMELFCDMFGSVLECYELTHVSWSFHIPRLDHASQLSRESCKSEHGCVIKSTHRGICSCSPIVNFLKSTFCHGMVTSVIFLIKK